MAFPEFNENGDLPVGIYEATLKEVVEHFGTQNLKRRRIAQRLIRIYDVGVRTKHLKRFIIFGSFVTDKLYPNDVDIFLQWTIRLTPIKFRANPQSFSAI